MTDLATDREGLEVLTPDQCYELLDTSPLGRVAFMTAGEPVILPVNHRLDGRTIAFRINSGATYDNAVMKRAVAFEVDGYDQATRTGWSVLVRGTADIEEDETVVARLEALDLHPWADGAERPDWVRIHATEVSGRRIPDRHAPQPT